jgi:hypothetical protein
MRSCRWPIEPRQSGKNRREDGQNGFLGPKWRPTVSPHYLQFTKGPRGCNKNLPPRVGGGGTDFQVIGWFLGLPEAKKERPETARLEKTARARLRAAKEKVIGFWRDIAAAPDRRRRLPRNVSLVATTGTGGGKKFFAREKWWEIGLLLARVFRYLEGVVCGCQFSPLSK